MNICCPHCRNAFESAGDVSWSDIICPSCGAEFSLTGAESTYSYSPGVKILGRFELLREVGAGRFGSVWKARDTELQRTVAVKIPRQKLLDALETEMFLRDARAAAQLKHPRIASVHEIGREGETVFIVSDYIDGANLAEWISAKQLSAVDSVEIVIKLADALEHAHQAGVIHRDLKLGNIMMDRSGDPYVIDFGLARREVGDMTLTLEGQLLGTPAYMSPEQARGEGHRADRRSDIYSLGVILFRLLTGELPFRGQGRMLLLQILDDQPPSPRKLNAVVPRDLETITLKCLEKAASNRYQTARELSSDLKCHLSGEPIKARPVSRVEHAWRWCKRHPDVASLSAALLLLLFGLAIGAGIVAVQQARSYRALQDQVAHNLFQRAYEEHNAGRIAEGITLLAKSYEFATRARSDDRLQRSIRTLLSGWAEHSGQPIIQNGAVLAAAFSPDGKIILIGGHDPQCRARFWNAHSLLPIGEPLRHDGSVRAVAFSPDGTLAITGSEDGTAALWNTQSRLPVGKPIQHSQASKVHQVLAVAISRDGTVATGGADRMARLWKLPLGDPLGAPLPHKGRVASVAFDPDGHVLLTGCYDGTAQLWRSDSGERMGDPIRVSIPPDYAARFSPDGTKILTGSSSGTAQLWNRKTGQLLGELVGLTNEVYSVAFSPDGRRMLTGSHDDTVQLWDTQTLKKVGPPLRHGGIVMCVDFSPDGRTLLTGAADRTVRLWNISDSDDRILRHQGSILGMAFSPSGNYVATIGEDRLACVWDAHTARQLAKPMPHDSPIQTLAISPDGKTLVTASSNLVLRWMARSGEQVGEPWKFGGEVRKVDFSTDGTTMLVQSANDKHQSIELRSFPSGEARLKSLEFSSDSMLLASSSDKQSIIMTDQQGPTPTAAQIWSFQSGQTAQHSLQHESYVTAAAFSRDGRRAVTVGRDQSVRVWNARTGDEEFVYKHNGIIKEVCISDDGGTILTGSNDKTARLWNAHTEVALGSPMQHPDQVSKVALTPDGRLAITICDDGSAYIWDVFSCKLVTQPMQFDVGVADCEIRPDSSAILFRCTDGSARLYDISRPVPGKTALIHAWALAHSGFQVDDSFEPRQLTQAEWMDAEKEARSLASIGTGD